MHLVQKFAETRPSFGIAYARAKHRCSISAAPSDLEAKNLELIRVYAEELKEVQELFTRDCDGFSSKAKMFERDGPPLYVNMPPVSGALAWVQGLIRRLEEPMRSLATVLRLMEDTDGAVEADKSTFSRMVAEFVNTACLEYLVVVASTVAELSAWHDASRAEGRVRLDSPR